MARSRLSRIVYITAAAVLLAAGCSEYRYQYRGAVKVEEHAWLKGKRIFVDPGHGGLGTSDPFRIGHFGVAEEDANLKAALVLANMLERAGASVAMSRRGDIGVTLDERIKRAESFCPDVLVSIHHNGSVRKFDGVNYPTVLFWGSREVSPAGYDLALILLEELGRTMEERGGRVLSDFSIFHETGTRILRETKYLCPGVLGECGFFSDEKHATRLRDMHYIESEAEAYFNALSRYFRWGLPSARVLFSCRVRSDVYPPNLITDRRPLIAIKVTSGNERREIDERSLTATLDGIPVPLQKLDADLFLVKYGCELYPGMHRLRFSFRNLRQQSSMVLSAPFAVEVMKGEYSCLVAEGKRLLRNHRTAREGLKMLLSALSMGPTDPESDGLVWDISRGYYIIGEKALSEYYVRRLFYFYPQSAYTKNVERWVRSQNSYFHPVDYYGKTVALEGDADIVKCAGIFGRHVQPCHAGK